MSEPSPERWRDDPASEKQLDYLKTFGFVPTEPISKGQASDLIGELKDRASEERERDLAYHLHLEYEQAKRELEEADQDCKQDAKLTLADSRKERLDFWQATFRVPFEMHSMDSEQAQKFYTENGYRLKIPSVKRIQEILDALDADSPTWDRDTPEYFFQTLEHNFPDLLRKNINWKSVLANRDPSKVIKISPEPSKPSGCLSLVVVLLVGIGLLAISYASAKGLHPF